MDILDTKLTREFAKGVASWNMAVIFLYPYQIAGGPNSHQFVTSLVSRLQNLVSYPWGRRFEKRWKLTSALVILNGSMVVNLYLLIHGRIPAKLVDLHGKSSSFTKISHISTGARRLSKRPFCNIFMFWSSPFRGEDAAERDKMRQKKAVPKWCVLCLQLELLVRWWSWWDLQSNRRSLYRNAT